MQQELFFSILQVEIKNAIDCIVNYTLKDVWNNYIQRMYGVVWREGFDV
jgi:hypothetical protein